MWELLALFSLSFALPIGVMMLKFKSQKSYDAQRKVYLLTFPSDLSADRIVAWLRSVTGSIHHGPSRMFGMPSIAFETYATSDGITHRILVPAMDAEYIVSQMRSLIPGINVTPDYDRPEPTWTAGLSIKMARPLRTMRATEPNDMASSLLASVSSLADDEVVMTQWIFSPAPRSRVPVQAQQQPSAEFRALRSLTGTNRALADEINERRAKLEEQNLLAAGRVVAFAKAPSRARSLVSRVQKALAGMHTSSNSFRVSPIDARDLFVVTDAQTPMLFSSQFTLTEATGVLAWPMGQPFVAGLPRGAARHLHATSDIPTDGITLGVSNVPGHERPVAVGYQEALSHTFIVGGTGSGKSSLMGNTFAQVVQQGYGGIVIDVGGSESHEAMYSRALSYIPDDRINDVILVDVKNGANNPVGFNILDQGSPGQVVDQITELWERLYEDSGKGVWLTRLSFHGLSTLVEAGGYSFIDIIPLVQPTKAQVAWSDSVKRAVKSPELREFWQEWDNLGAQRQAEYARPLMNRAWQLASRPQTRNIIGQSESTFRMDDVINENKILLVNLAGIPQDAAKLLASLFMDALWNSAQHFTPAKPNYLFIDEAQLLKLPMKVDDMLARARKHKLGVTVATQNVETLDADVQRGVMTNALTKVIYQVSGRDASLWTRELGRKYFSEDDLAGIGKYEAVAKVATQNNNVSAPITIKVAAPMQQTFNDRRVIAASEATYGVDAEKVRESIEARRTPSQSKKSERPPLSNWDA